MPLVDWIERLCRLRALRLRFYLSNNLKEGACEGGGIHDCVRMCKICTCVWWWGGRRKKKILVLKTCVMTITKDKKQFYNICKILKRGDMR